MIRFENVSKVYKADVVAVRDITLDVNKGEFVFLVGPSGSGKSTLLKLLLRDEFATSGRILVAGRDISRLGSWRMPQLRRNIGCVFQDFKLLPNKTVYENVAFALEVIGRPRHVVRTQVPQILDLVGLTKKSHNFPGELSGGEQQRVSIARAFVNRRHHAAARSHQPHRYHRRDGDARPAHRRRDAPSGHRARPRNARARPSARRLRSRLLTPESERLQPCRA